MSVADWADRFRNPDLLRKFEFDFTISIRPLHASWTWDTMLDANRSTDVLLRFLPFLHTLLGN